MPSEGLCQQCRVALQYEKADKVLRNILLSERKTYSTIVNMALIDIY